MSHIKRSLTEAAQKPVATFYGFKGAPSARKAGIPKGTGLHFLRHYFATLLIHSDASVKRVQLALGHSTPHDHAQHVRRGVAGHRPADPIHR